MTVNGFEIAGRRVGGDAAPYVIAELSANHNGSLATALALVEAAHKTGADAIKIQTYRPDTITLPSQASEFQISDGLWAGRTLWDLYQEAHLPWEWHKPLFDKARALGITIFSSPFDPTAVDLLEELGAPAYKVASFEAIDLGLIRYIAQTGKPMIISTGMTNAEEIGEALDVARSAGCRELAILHCVSGYPAPAEEYNLRTLSDMAAKFGVPVGLSDHTLGTTTAVTSIALGASVIEKHFTLDRTGGSPDDAFSLEPDEFRLLCNSVRTAWQALGKVDYGLKSSEIGSVKFRRSLYWVKPLAAGEIVPEDAVRSVRPGYGLPPKHAPEIIGQKLVRAVTAHTPVCWDQIKSP